MHPHWPPLLLGLLVGAYWARVVKMVLKQRRQTGRDANFVPRERLGLALRFIWYPVVVLWIVLPLVAACSRNGPRVMHPLYESAWVEWPAVMVAVVAFAATWVCWKRMGKSWRMGIDPA